MEQENVEFILDGYARINAGWRGPEGYEELGIWQPDGEYHVAREDPDSAIHRGLGATARHVAVPACSRPQSRSGFAAAAPGAARGRRRALCSAHRSV